MSQHDTTGLKANEQIDIGLLSNYISQQTGNSITIQSITRFTGGYSNLTYLLHTTEKDYVLRRPPVGANIKSAHDMGREFRVLSLVKPHYDKVPGPVCYCEDDTLIGAPFYIMEKLPGTILRAQQASSLQIDAAVFRKLSETLIKNLASIHAIDIQQTGLHQLGKPEGYVQRQTDGWIKRYYAAETDKIASMDAVAQWLQQTQPSEQAPALLHNDYKYDNVLLNPNNLAEITGVLDWEMATIGDPLMDLGASLAYWFEEGEGDMFKQYNLTWLPGNLRRKEVVEYYGELSGRNLEEIRFYYVFGLFKNAVIAQQIYHRWKQGHSSDARFGALLPLIQLLGNRAALAIEKGI